MVTSFISLLLYETGPHKDKGFDVNTDGPQLLPHWPRPLSLAHSLQRQARNLPLTATPEQVAGFNLVFLSVNVGSFGPCHLVRKVEDAELPLRLGLYLPQRMGSGLPIRLVVWLPPQPGASGGGSTPTLRSPLMKDVLESCWLCPCGTLS